MANNLQLPGNVFNKTVGIMRSLAAVMNDRQPEAEKQAPETEWRRQRDLYASVYALRDALIATIKLLQQGQLSPLTQKGAILTHDKDSDEQLDPATQGTSILVSDPTTKTGLRWDHDLWQQVSECCSGGINSLDYGLISDAPATLFGDYGLVADPPTSTYDFGLITDPP